MSPTDRIPSALAEIADVLRNGSFIKHSGDILELRRLALSADETDQEKFKKEITTNKWYWLGMGTIADITLPTPDANRRFIVAYHDLAMACCASEFDSIYSRDVATVFGSWLKR
jgi:hypothetical protein